MKKYIVTIFFLCLALMSFSQEDAISKYFESYMDDENFTVVYISGRMFTMFADVEDEDAETKAALKGIKGLRILTSEKNGVGLYKEAKSKFNVGEYEEIMQIRDGEDRVNFYIKEEGDTIKELLLLVGGDDFVLISFIGDINLKAISKISDSIDIDGMEHLDEVQDAK